MRAPVHAWEPSPPPPDPEVPCCQASVIDPDQCSCWTAVYWPVAAGDTITVQTGPSAVRGTRCGDCAFRRDSPERADEDGGLPASYHPDREFWCHDGLPKLVGFTHPDLPGVCIRWTPDGGIGQHDNYAAPLIAQPSGAARVWQHDGRPAVICAGWWGHARRDLAEAE